MLGDLYVIPELSLEQFKRWETQHANHLAHALVERAGALIEQRLSTQEARRINQIVAKRFKDTRGRRLGYGSAACAVSLGAGKATHRYLEREAQKDALAEEEAAKAEELGSSSPTSNGQSSNNVGDQRDGRATSGAGSRIAAQVVKTAIKAPSGPKNLVKVAAKETWSLAKRNPVTAAACVVVFCGVTLFGGLYNAFSDDEERRFRKTGEAVVKRPSERDAILERTEQEYGEEFRGRVVQVLRDYLGNHAPCEALRFNGSWIHHPYELNIGYGGQQVFPSCSLEMAGNVAPSPEGFVPVNTIEQVQIEQDISGRPAFGVNLLQVCMESSLLVEALQHIPQSGNEYLVDIIRTVNEGYKRRLRELSQARTFPAVQPLHLFVVHASTKA